MSWKKKIIEHILTLWSLEPWCTWWKAVSPTTALMPHDWIFCSMCRAIKTGDHQVTGTWTARQWQPADRNLKWLRQDSRELPASGQSDRPSQGPAHCLKLEQRDWLWLSYLNHLAKRPGTGGRAAAPGWWPGSGPCTTCNVMGSAGRGPAAAAAAALHNFELNLKLLIDSGRHKFKFKISLTPSAWPAALLIRAWTRGEFKFWPARPGASEEVLHLSKTLCFTCSMCWRWTKSSLDMQLCFLIFYALIIYWCGFNLPSGIQGSSLNLFALALQ